MTTELSDLGRSSTRDRKQRPDMSALVLPPRLELDHPLVHTPSFRSAATAMTALLGRNKIGLIDGPPGTGKTTFAQWAAEKCDRPSAVAVMPENPAPLDILRISITAVTGHNPFGDNKTEMEAELATALGEWRGLLILDEVQNVRIKGLTEARYIHDITRPRFPLLLVGYGAMATVRENTPLDSRIRLRRTFRELDGQDLFDTVRALDDRLAGVSDDVIRYADDKFARGNLRRWIDLLETLQDWDVTEATQTDFDDAIVSIDEQVAA
jgi:DNA transposition AAA+ family ATPase